jgi:hypothetical protein
MEGGWIGREDSLTGCDGKLPAKADTAPREPMHPRRQMNGR